MTGSKQDGTRARLIETARGPALAIMAGLLIVIAVISPGFTYELSEEAKPAFALAALMMVAGAAYLVAVRGLLNAAWRGRTLVLAIGIGVLLRAMMFFTTPALEDDYYRYLWDGGVLAHGMSPYAYSSEQALDADSDAPARLKELAADSGVVVLRVNHPSLRTIYPPVAQAAFALAHFISPWSLQAWRLVILLFDAATLALILLILDRLGLPACLSMIYWLNPLLIKELYNSGHMDAVMLPFLMGALYMSIRGRFISSAALLALAAGAKFWPLMLAPILLRPAFKDVKKIVPALAILVLICAALFLPVYLGGLDRGSGVTAYSGQWEMNDALYMALFRVAKRGVRAFTNDQVWSTAHLFTRAFVGLALIAWVLRLAWRESGPLQTVEKTLLAVAGLFLLSPTEFPWYYIWLLPLLSLRPRTSLLLFTALLPLYYLRFHYSSRGEAEVFDNWIVWIEFVPVWAMLAWEWRGHGRRTAEAGAG